MFKLPLNGIHLTCQQSNVSAFEHVIQDGHNFPSEEYTECTEELYKKDLYDQDSHDGVITHLEPDILECEVKWALGSITMNKGSGGDGIPTQLFQILKDNTMNVLPSICQQF